MSSEFAPPNPPDSAVPPNRAGADLDGYSGSASFVAGTTPPLGGEPHYREPPYAPEPPYAEPPYVAEPPYAETAAPAFPGPYVPPPGLVDSFAPLSYSEPQLGGDPANSPQGVGEALSIPASLAPINPPEPTPPRRQRRWPLVALGAVVGALVASLVSFGLRGVLDEDRASTTLAGDLGGGGLSVAELLDRVGPSVVSIQVGEVRNADIFGGSGTGFLISGDGHILTNAHVVNGAQRIRVGFSDGNLREAKLIGSIPDRDIALIRLTDVPKGLEPAVLGSSDEVIVGDAVVAIGNALNLGAAPSVTVGVVSAKDRSISAQNIELTDLIQTDAAINPGNSGGPLINVEGEVVGVVTAIASEGQNIGFALSIDQLKPLITDIEEGRSVVNPDTAFLGVKTSSVDELTVGEREELGVNSGAVVVSVIADSAAEKGGLIPGDVILAVDGKSIDNPDGLGAGVRSHKPGEQMELRVKSATGERTITVTLGKTGG